MDRYVFDNEHDFLDKLRALVKSGVRPRHIEVHAPHPVHHMEDILEMAPSKVRLFALIGGLLGAFTGYAATSWMSIDWPLIIGGKPVVSIPPYTIIAFELMVLFGSLFAFAGFVILSRMPAVRTIISQDEFQDSFEIHVRNGHAGKGEDL
jgi:hypothetical protein